MRITNLSNKIITFSDLDRGIDYQAGVYEQDTAKGPTSLNPNSFMDVLDTDRTLLSAELGQIKKMKVLSYVSTQASLKGSEMGPVSIVEEENDELVVLVDGASQTIAVEEGTYSMAQLAEEINGSASGFSADGDSGFLVLVSEDYLEIGDGSMNSSLGFIKGQKTLAK
jgi:hypothetical protein